MSRSEHPPNRFQKMFCFKGNFFLPFQKTYANIGGNEARENDANFGTMLEPVRY